VLRYVVIYSFCHSINDVIEMETTLLVIETLVHQAKQVLVLEDLM
jgi:hypothetical protein